MKNIFKLLVFFTVLAGCTSSSDQSEPSWYSEYKPILMNRTEMENSVAFIEKQDMKQPTKIYVKGSYIFISEKYKGIHVIDNHNPASPVKIGFIRVPGCVDMAIKGNTLYADNAVDLIAITFDSTNWQNLAVSKRIKSIFPELAPPDYDYIPTEFSKPYRPQNTVIVGWKNK